MTYLLSSLGVGVEGVGCDLQPGVHFVHRTGQPHEVFPPGTLGDAILICHEQLAQKQTIYLVSWLAMKLSKCSSYAYHHVSVRICHTNS